MKAVCLVFCVVVAASAFAQTDEIALTVGAYFPQHLHVQSDTLFAIEGAVAHRIFQVPKVSLYLEFPIAATTDSRAKALVILGGQSFTTRNCSALFFSPGLKLKLFPERRLSPYIAAGGGLAHFSKSGSPSTNTGVFDVGAGLDVSLTRFLALRAEVRDFYSGPPQIITGLLEREHQVFATGGVVFRF